MRKIRLNYRFAALTLAALMTFATTSCSDDDNDDMPISLAPDVNFTALANNNTIVKYNARNLSTPTSTTPITGLTGGEQITSIDYRPATGQLYGLGTSSRIYVINEQSGAATAIGTTAFTPLISGNNASLNFNPAVDRIRLVTESGQNLRLNPETGAVAATDLQIAGNANTKIGAVAYTNSTAGAASTSLYDIDFGEDKLYIQNPPNNGTLVAVGTLTVDFQGVGDFDIMADNSQAMAVTYFNSQSKLYTIDLTTGKAVDVGTFALPVIGLAFKTNAVAYATTSDNMLYRLNPMSPSMNPVALGGLAAGETVVGLDFRPLNGMLYAITSQSRLMTVNTATGALTQVGATLATPLSGTSFGFDFNPTVDRIRLVSNTGQNLRLHPDTGAIAATDSSLSPGTPSVNGAAYTNNFAGATATTLFAIDSNTDMLYSLASPNTGVLTAVGPLGMNVEADNGFDIGGASNAGFALLKVGGVSSVYSINTTTGAATMVAGFNVPVTAMAVGLGF